MAERPAVSIYLIARDAAKALDFYVQGLGASEVERWIDPENGKVGHAEFRIGGMSLFLADEYPSMDKIGVRSPKALGGTSLNLWIEVGDVKPAMERALAVGGVLREAIMPATDGGVRCRIADPAGHIWTLAGR
jgi:PhnB protein